jgi:hypothetical protein
VRKYLEAITDLNRLHALTVRLLHVDSWEDLLAEDPSNPTPPRRPHRPRKSENP